MKRTVFFIICSTLSLTALSQKHRKFFYATLQDEMGAVANAHVINLTTKQGTFTNDYGKFKVLAKPNDTLQISFVGYETKKFMIGIHHFGIQENTIQLKKVPIELEEVELKKHDLTGFIALDSKKTPEDLTHKPIKKLMDIIMGIDYSTPIIKKLDYIDKHVKPPNVETDPTQLIQGVSLGLVISLSKGKSSKKQRDTRKKLKSKETFHKMLLSEFGEHFFFKELKIPKEKYLHFLTYCNPLGIEKLYKEGKVLKVIAILQEESKSYLKIKNEKE
ncbi:carboxypeptidase-like regulatory domain-containing protein [Tenacibaculum tangerinum]|uniref:Carboxypeptidase-like regulatory domain-containing protein n=1 Tax=Tenacibaculum tangerinum TaxID=3038772 RepID=A0ABY8L5I5_9FLAO|nr:carboxypeptidase-like regulatory domain-containing protein [Tenacibaculum tangerinum]WGH76676.1 carboxypeptidase-like regulatory domain-containing protein [Tenacibaculum tangerinum]